MARAPLSIPAQYNDGVTNLALDTIRIKKQALVFVNTKRAAESQAEKIALKVKDPAPVLAALAEQALKILPSPTKQCQRLALCLRKGIAFHHAGLHARQRTLVEDAFRAGTIQIICCTPTLAYGLNLPAFRTIVRDLKRYGMRGMAPIPILEYHQFIGRSGRPDFHDTHGEAITLAQSEHDEESIVDHYIKAKPEPIYSKLAVEPVLRMHVLSLIAMGIVQNKPALDAFFAKTLYGHHYQDPERLGAILGKITGLLQHWGFLSGVQEADDFVAADTLQQASQGRLEATRLGQRVAQLYLDPLTAHHLLDGIERARDWDRVSTMGLLALFACCLELRPLLRVRTGDIAWIESMLNKHSAALLIKEPSPYSDEYDTFLDMFKTALFLQDWIDETNEESLLEQYAIRPGEIHAKLDILDWLVYSALELARLQGWQEHTTELMKLRQRLKYGAREELLPLLRLKRIGRVRARLLYAHRIRDLGDVRKADVVSLAQLLGKHLALDIKEQVGQKLDPDHIQVKKRKRKGQINLQDF